MGLKGQPKTGGRKRGVSNKKLAHVKEKAMELGIDPFEVLLYFAAGDWKSLGYKSEFIIKVGKDFQNEEFVIPPAVRMKAAADAAQYLHSKLKSVDHTGTVSFEHSGPDKGPINIKELTDEELEEQARLYQSQLDDLEKSSSN